MASGHQKSRGLALEGEQEGQITELVRAAEDDWGEEEEEYEESELSGAVPVRAEDQRRSVLSRTGSEAAIALFFHTLVLCYYMYAMVWEASLVKHSSAPDRIWYGATNFAGRWKFLTYLNMVKMR